jgi:hypothetical protein
LTNPAVEFLVNTKANYSASVQFGIRLRRWFSASTFDAVCHFYLCNTEWLTGDGISSRRNTEAMESARGSGSNGRGGGALVTTNNDTVLNRQIPQMAGTNIHSIAANRVIGWVKAAFGPVTATRGLPSAGKLHSISAG